MDSELANNIALFKNRLLVMVLNAKDMKMIYRRVYKDIFKTNIIGRYALDMMALKMEHLIRDIKENPGSSVGHHIASLINEQANYIENAFIKSYECIDI